MKRIKIGIIGCGTIGAEIAKACATSLKRSFTLIGVTDIDSAKALTLRRELGIKTAALPSDELIDKVDLIVEAASAKVSPEILKKAIAWKKDALIMSIGGLVGHEHLLDKARQKGIRVYLPSGALCGLDGVKASSVGNIASVSLTTRKPPKGLMGAPYIQEKGIDLGAIDRETVIFDGTAAEAVKAFPQNVNVCAVLSLAGIGAAKTRVRVVTSPAYTKNIHEVEIAGDAGTIMTRTENLPSKTNPKTSALAFFSAIATLRGIADTVKIGT